MKPVLSYKITDEDTGKTIIECDRKEMSFHIKHGFFCDVMSCTEVIACDLPFINPEEIKEEE